MKKVSLVHCADIHLGKVRFNKHEEEIDFFNGFTQLVDYCIQNNVDGLLLAGDIFDRHQISPQTLLKAEAILNRLNQKQIQVIAIYGNHDGSLTKTDFNWLDYLSQKGLVKFLKIPFKKNEPIIETWDEDKKQGGMISIKGVTIYGLGHLGSTLEDRLQSLVNKIEANDFNILLLHADLQNRVHDERDKLKDKEILTQLKEKIHYLALGHIHSCYIHEDWAYNPGSLENVRIQETDYKKGFFHLLIDLETKDKTVTLQTIQRRNTFLFDNEKDCELGGCRNVEEVYQRIEAFIKSLTVPIPEESIIRLSLKGGLYFSAGDIEPEKIIAMWNKFNPYYVEINNECFWLEEGVNYRVSNLTQEEIEKEELIHQIEASSAYKKESEKLAKLIQKLIVQKSENLLNDEEIFQELNYFRQSHF